MVAKGDKLSSLTDNGAKATTGAALTGGKIAGIVIASLAGAALLAIGIWYCYVFISAAQKMQREIEAERRARGEEN
jgi:uncharacterized protein (DUF2062 family)